MMASPARASLPRLRRTTAKSRWGEYRGLLEHGIRAGLQPVSVETWLRSDPGADLRPALILRHDVDQHPRSALAMAEIERSLGLSSTWYFRWRTANAAVISTLRDADFSIGFHYETLTRRELAGPGSSDDLAAGRAELKREIKRFSELFGEVHSITPHGDSRMPGISNASLMRDQDPSRFGIEFDANEAMRGRTLAYWLTDRALGGKDAWSNDLDPIRVLECRHGSVLFLSHPNNWVSGAGLWVDRLLSGAFPAPSPTSRPVRTGSDSPPP